MNLAWIDNANNEQGFYIERSPDGTTFAQIAAVGANTVSYADTSADASTSYYYQVRAYNAVGNSAYSNIATATTSAVLTVPVAPSPLNASTISSTQVDLAWTDNADNEDGFKIERSADGVSFTQIAAVTTNVTGYSDTTGAASTTYSYRVRAYNNAGDSPYSNTATATTAPAPVTIPAAPSGLTATAVSSTVVNLVWTDNADNEDGFKIERSDDGVTFTQLATLAGNLTAYSDLTAAPSSTYYYRVASYSSAGSSPYSNVATVTTASVPVPLPSAPSGLTATAISSTQVDLAWTDNADNENGFKIERSKNGNSFSQIGTVAANITGYSDTTGAASTTYIYRVRAYNNSGDSPYSNTATATTAPPPVTVPSAPSGLTATAVSSTVVNLVWTDNADNEDGFTIERSIDGVTFTQLATAASNSTTYSDQTAAPSSTYFYRVAAYNSAGNSPYSNIATATTGSTSCNATVSPGQSLGTAMGSIGSGQTLCVHGGTYTENISVIMASGAKVVAYPGERPVVVGLLWFTNLSNVTIDGINVTWNSSNTASQHMVKFSGGSGWVYKNSEVWGAHSFAGILVSAGASSFTLQNLYVHDTYPSNKTNQDHLLYINDANYGVVERSLFVNSTNGRGVKLGPSSGSGGPGNIIVRYNTLYNNTGPSNVQLSYGAHHNQVYRNIFQMSSAENVTAYNLSGIGNTVHDNVGWESTAVAVPLLDTGGNLHIDPQFVSTSNNDFHPQNSQAVNYGLYDPFNN